MVEMVEVLQSSDLLFGGEAVLATVSKFEDKIFNKKPDFAIFFVVFDGDSDLPNRFGEMDPSHVTLGERLEDVDNFSLDFLSLIRLGVSSYKLQKILILSVGTNHIYSPLFFEIGQVGVVMESSFLFELN